MSSEKEILGLEDKRFGAMMVHAELLYTRAAASGRCASSGDVALVRGKAAIEAEIGGQARSLKLLFLNAWVKTPQGWTFAAWQSCPQPT